MNLTLFLVTPSVPEDRPLYVLAPDVASAIEAVKHFLPNPARIEAVANNAHIKDTFPRFMAWDGTRWGELPPAAQGREEKT